MLVYFYALDTFIEIRPAVPPFTVVSSADRHHYFLAVLPGPVVSTVAALKLIAHYTTRNGRA